jgi:PPOX class probable F420-dependent enzyme
MKEMQDEERRQFLLAGTRTAKLATVREDGQPHAVPVWFDMDGDELVFTTFHTTVKAANMRRDPRVCICVDDQQPPFAFVHIEGTAEIEESAPNLKYWTTRIAGRYMGSDQADEFGERNAAPGELLVRVTPTKIIARAELAD